jgi:hypothetical protein
MPDISAGAVTVNSKWDVSATAFVRSLMVIASQGNVQPQAVLAAEALGFVMIASPKAIDAAIVALNENESIRMAKFNLYIGLSSLGRIWAF